MDSDELRVMLEQGAKGPIVTLLVAIDEARAHHIPEEVVRYMVEAARRMIVAVPNPNRVERRIRACLLAARPAATLDPQAFQPIGGDSVSVLLTREQRQHGGSS